MFVYFSCKNRTILENTLLVKHSRWHYVSGNLSNIPLDSLNFIGYLKFYENGKCANFSVKENFKLDKNGKWNFNNKDSTFTVNGFSFKVVKFNVDSICLINKNNVKEYLIKKPNIIFNQGKRFK